MKLKEMLNLKSVATEYSIVSAWDGKLHYRSWASKLEKRKPFEELEVCSISSKISVKNGDYAKPYIEFMVVDYDLRHKNTE